MLLSIQHSSLPMPTTLLPLPNPPLPLTYGVVYKALFFLLDALTHLNMRLCPPICSLIPLSVHLSVCLSQLFGNRKKQQNLPQIFPLSVGRPHLKVLSQSITESLTHTFTQTQARAHRWHLFALLKEPLTFGLAGRNVGKSFYE